jgi:1-acyl-sn-glycerol-3-phosphate acyltransferase
MSRPFAVAFSYAEFLLSAVTFVPVLGAARLSSRGDPTRRIAGRWLRNFGKVTSALNPLWHFSTEGAPPSDIGSRAYVVISNHESNADPFLLSWLPWDMRWISKEELFTLPLVGTLMRLGGDIALRRGDPDSVRHMMAECRATLDQGLSVMIFPEGTRSRDGELGAFKDGAFRLAIEAGVPILPVAIAGTRSCLPKGSAALGEARAVARVLAPIDTAKLTLDDVASLREQARGQIAQAASELRAQLGQ